MTRIAYWVCFSLVLFSFLVGLLPWLFYWTAGRSPNFMLALSVFSFGSLVPPRIGLFVPSYVHSALGYGMLVLLLRRIWLVAFKKERVPSSFRGFPKLLGYMGALFFSVSILAFALSIKLQVGSGIPAAFLMFPAMVFVPWSFFLTEVLTFRRSAT